MTETQRVACHTERLGNFRWLDEHRASNWQVMQHWLLDDPASRGRVLDVGCGGATPGGFVELEKIARQIDGVDPDPAVLTHPALTLRWHGPFEEADIPENAYDLAYAMYVAEHIPAARPFFEKLARVLKPGGVFLAMTPNATHPFPTICRAIQVSIGKRLWSRFKREINLYPAYYRLNTPRRVLRAIEGLPFSSVEFFYVPCVHWDMYFPRSLRWAPHLYDRAVGARFGPAMLTLAYRMIKSAD